MKKYFSSVLLLFFFSSSFSQVNPAVISFTARQVKEGVRLDFTIREGNVCSGVTIERSDDSVYFSPSGEILGVCGSSSVATTYTFTDMHPLSNQDNYYRLNLHALGLSGILKIHPFDFSEKKYIIVPHPCRENCLITFKNELHQEMIFKLYSMDGKEFYAVPTKSDFIDLSNLLFQQGIYFFSMEKEGEVVFKGKIMILRDNK